MKKTKNKAMVKIVDPKKDSFEFESKLFCLVGKGSKSQKAKRG